MHRAAHGLCSLTPWLLMLSTVAIQRLPSCNIRADTNSTEENCQNWIQKTQLWTHISPWTNKNLKTFDDSILLLANMQEEIHVLLTSVPPSKTGLSTEDNLSVCSYSSSWFISYCLHEKHTQALQLHWLLACDSNPRNICTFWFEKDEKLDKNCIRPLRQVRIIAVHQHLISCESKHYKVLMLQYQWCIFLRMFAFPQDWSCLVNISFYSLHWIWDCAPFYCNIQSLTV